MKKLFKNRNKIFAIIIAIVIIAGIIMLITCGFNKQLVYQSSKRIEGSITKGFEKSDIESIAKEVFSTEEIQVQDIEKTGQIFSVRLKNYTDEELENFETKLAEKYEVETDDLSIQEVDVPATRIKDIVSPYVFSVSLVTILSLVYISLRNIKKKDMLKKVAKLLLALIIVAGLYFSIIVIARIPVNEFMMPTALVLYVLTLLIGIIKIQK